jgi:hypothetical protein
VQQLLEPQLVDLVDDDEQQLVVLSDRGRWAASSSPSARDDVAVGAGDASLTTARSSPSGAGTGAGRHARPARAARSVRLGAAQLARDLRHAGAGPGEVAHRADHLALGAGGPGAEALDVRLAAVHLVRDVIASPAQRDDEGVAGNGGGR